MRVWKLPGPAFLWRGGTIAGEKILSFLTEGLEGFDINQPEDWWLAEELIKRGQAVLPPVAHPPLEVISS